MFKYYILYYNYIKKNLITYKHLKINIIKKSLKMDKIKIVQSNNKENLKNTSDSQIQKFYTGKYIFFTGCTSILGSSILEKILISCTEISKIYIMIKLKNDILIKEQLKKYFQNEVSNIIR